jgi:DNA repair ATPase RecN
LHSNAHAIDEKIQSCWHSLMHSLQELETIYHEYQKHSCTSEKYNKVLYNLQRRYEMATDLASICHKFESLTHEVNNTKQRLDTVAESLDEFSDLEYCLE